MASTVDPTRSAAPKTAGADAPLAGAGGASPDGPELDPARSPALGEEELLDRRPACRRRPRHRRDHLRRHRRAHRHAAQPRPQRAGRGALRALRAADVGEARRRGASRPRPARDDVRRDRAADPRPRATLGRRQGGRLPERRDDPRALRPGGQDLGARRPAGGRRRRPFRRRELGPRSPQPERGAGAHRSQRGDRRGPRRQQPPLAQGLRIDAPVRPGARRRPWASPTASGSGTS